MSISPRILRHLRKGLDTDGSGHVTHQEGGCGDVGGQGDR